MKKNRANGVCEVVEQEKVDSAAPEPAVRAFALDRRSLFLPLVGAIDDQFVILGSGGARGPRYPPPSFVPVSVRSASGCGPAIEFDQAGLRERVATDSRRTPRAGRRSSLPRPGW